MTLSRYFVALVFCFTGTLLAEPPDQPAPRTKVTEANQLLEAYAKENPKVTRLRIWEEFMNEDGTLPPEVMPDKLHLSEKGYAIWAEAMLPTLQSLLAAP